MLTKVHSSRPMERAYNLSLKDPNPKPHSRVHDRRPRAAWACPLRKVLMRFSGGVLGCPGRPLPHTLRRLRDFTLKSESWTWNLRATGWVATCSVAHSPWTARQQIFVDAGAGASEGGDMADAPDFGQRNLLTLRFTNPSLERLFRARHAEGAIIAIEMM